MDGLTNSSPNAKAATPKQQKQFDLLLGRARQMMEASNQEWMAALKQDPINGAVMMGTQTIRALVKMSEEAGQPVDPTVLVHVGVQFIKDIAGIANAAGLVPDNQLQTFLKEVLQQSIAAYLKEDKADGQEPKGMLARMQDDSEANDGPGPDNTPQHEQGESPAVEQQEGSEEDTADDPEMANELAKLRAKRGA